MAHDDERRKTFFSHTHRVPFLAQRSQETQLLLKGDFLYHFLCAPEKCATRSEAQSEFHSNKVTQRRAVFCE